MLQDKYIIPNQDVYYKMNFSQNKIYSEDDPDSFQESPSESSRSFIKKEARFEQTDSFSQEPQLPNRKKGYKLRRAILRIPFIVFWLALLWVGAKIAWRESRYAESTSALLVANLIEVRAPFTTELTSIHVQEGDQVTENEVLAVLNAQQIEQQLEMLLELKAIKAEGPKSIEREILEEKSRRVQFTDASIKREAMYRTELERMNIELNFAKSKEDRLLEAYKTNTIPYIDLEEANSIRRAMQKDIFLAQQRLLLQKLITSNSEKGILFSDSFQMFGNITELESRKATLTSELTALDIEIKKVREQIKRYRITTPRKGRVFAVNADWGTMVQEGEPLLTIETEEEIFAIGWFKFDEAQKIGFDTEAEVTLPSLKKTYKGRVTAIGQSALAGLKSAVSSTSPVPGEVLMKIRFDEQPPELKTGLRARIRVKHDAPL